MNSPNNKNAQNEHKAQARSLHERAYSVVATPGSGSTANRIFNGTISFLILVSVAVIVANTCDIPEQVFYINIIIQAVISVIFTLEYFLRLWVSDLARPELSPAKARLRFVISPASLIDLLSFLPFWVFMFAPFDLSFLAAFRVLRLMRLLRISFYSKALSVVGTVLKSCAKQLFSALLLLMFLMLIASILMYNAEHAVQPEAFDNALSGYWWALQTVTTIGYGDIYPITFWGRTLGVVIALLGVGTVAIPTGIISAAFVAWSKDVQKQKEAENNTEG